MGCALNVTGKTGTTKLTNRVCQEHTINFSGRGGREKATDWVAVVLSVGVPAER